MIARFSVLLAIILHTITTLHAHAISKRDVTLPTDARELIPGSRSTTGVNDDQIRYQPDYSKDTNKYSQSRLISSLVRDFEVAGKQPQPETQSSQKSQPHIEQTYWTEDEEDEKENEKNSDLEKPEQYEDLGEEEVGEEFKNIKKYDGEYDEQEKDERGKSEVHLFGPSALQQRNNLKEFQLRNRYPIDLQKTLSESQEKDANPKIARVERPESDAAHFSYIHPEEWSLNNPECSGRLQSPVNLDSDQLVGLDVPSSLIWTGYWNRPQNLAVVDNGHSVELSGTWDKETSPFISGGPLVGDYLFAQLHFHWGPKDSVGSEHTIDNKSFPMEMHMVHYKKDYGTLKGALKHDDGLAVVAFLFEIGDTSNFGINLLEDSLSKIQNKPGVRVPVKPYPLALLHFIFQEDYASYIGSLTTPPCREIVTWLVSSSPLTVSRKQLESFRKISNKWPEKENYRPRQALNGRHLYYVAH